MNMNTLLNIYFNNFKNYNTFFLSLSLIQKKNINFHPKHKYVYKYKLKIKMKKRKKIEKL